MGGLITGGPISEGAYKRKRKSTSKQAIALQSGPIKINFACHIKSNKRKEKREGGVYLERLTIGSFVLFLLFTSNIDGHVSLGSL